MIIPNIWENQIDGNQTTNQLHPTSSNHPAIKPYTIPSSQALRRPPPSDALLGVGHGHLPRGVHLGHGPAEGGEVQGEEAAGLLEATKRKTHSGWWFFYHPSEKYEFVNWDDDIPNINGKIKNVPNHQPAL